MLWAGSAGAAPISLFYVLQSPLGQGTGTAGDPVVLPALNNSLVVEVWVSGLGLGAGTDYIHSFDIAVGFGAPLSPAAVNPININSDPVGDTLPLGKPCGTPSLCQGTGPGAAQAFFISNKTLATAAYFDAQPDAFMLFDLSLKAAAFGATTLVFSSVSLNDLLAPLTPSNVGTFSVVVPEPALGLLLACAALIGLRRARAG